MGIPRGLHRIAHLLPQIWFTHGPRHHCPMGTEDGNDTGNYIRKVCVLTGFPPDKCLNPYDPSHMAPLVAAMSRVECGVKPIMSQIKEGWSLYMVTD